MTITLTPALKGQLTKARKAGQPAPSKVVHYIRNSFMAAMPSQQAKHATRQYLASI